jgi:hypothetical protein
MQIALIIGGLLLFAAFIYNFFAKDGKLRISQAYCLYAPPKDNIKILRIEVSREIDFKIKKSPNFKIGKTDKPKVQAANKEYSEYKTMHLVCKSTQAAIIDDLEAYCIEKYNLAPNEEKLSQENQKNQKLHFFYLYIVVEE